MQKTAISDRLKTGSQPVQSIDSDFRMFELVKTADDASEKSPLHRHNYQEIIYVEEGQVCHHIDGEQYDVTGPYILVVAQGKVHALVPHPNSKILVVRFTNEFLKKKTDDLFSHFIPLSKIPVASEEVRKKIANLLQLMLAEYKSDQVNFDVLRHLLSACISMLREEKRKLWVEDKSCKGTNYDLFNKFLQELELNFTSNQSVEFYASKLNLTTKKLGEVCKEVFGDSPSRIIEKRALLEAKRLLMYSSLTIQEITFSIGYNDHSYFTKAFRKSEGVTPTEFRQQHSVAA